MICAAPDIGTPVPPMYYETLQSMSVGRVISLPPSLRSYDKHRGLYCMAQILRTFFVTVNIIWESVNRPPTIDRDLFGV